MSPNIFALPITHYKMEMAAQVRLAMQRIQPDCVAVEFAETMQLQLLHAASRLPDISLVMAYDTQHSPITYLCEPCDAGFEALRSALENKLPAYCIDLDVDYYPEKREILADPYAIARIGLAQYYNLYRKSVLARGEPSSPTDRLRELHMAKRLKELSLSYERILFVGGMAHTQNVLNLIARRSFPESAPAQREIIQICTPTEESCREIMGESGWISLHYETWRNNLRSNLIEHQETAPDRLKLIYKLYKTAGERYATNSGHSFPGYQMRNLMKFARNYALISGQLTPDLYQILAAAKGCVDHNYAYETWELATTYPHRRNIDNLPELDFSIEDIWGPSKIIRFHLKEQGRKSGSWEYRRRKQRSLFRFLPPSPFGICSYQPEDLVIERFGEFLKKKGSQILLEESSRTIPFSTSLEDGIDTRETIRHWHERKLFVKTGGKPPGTVGSVVIIFEEDSTEEGLNSEEKYSWKTTWLGEHNQESDMAFYATPMTANVIGPGISRCEYGGFMMSYPPRRMQDVWFDSDYSDCRTKAEVLLSAAIDYAIKPLIVYVAAKPPRSALKSFAKRFGKKLVYLPIGQLSPVTLNKLRLFHVLDNHSTRDIAGEFID